MKRWLALLFVWLVAPILLLELGCKLGNRWGFSLPSSVFYREHEVKVEGRVRPESIYAANPKGFHYITGAGSFHAKAFGPAESPIFDVHYEFDEYARRRVSQKNLQYRRSHLVVFGCSFVFGIGVTDQNTLPSALAAHLPQHHVYNFGVFGQSPATLYLHAREDDSWKGVNERDGVAVYVYIDDHLNRVIGSLAAVANWDGLLPKIRLKSDQRAEYKGTYKNDEPFITGLYAWVYKKLWNSETRKFFRIANWPAFYREADFTFLGATILDLKEEYLRRVGKGEFVVVIYPLSMTAPWLRKELERRGIAYIDYSADSRIGDITFFPYEGHPTGESNRKVATILAADLIKNQGAKKALP